MIPETILKIINKLQENSFEVYLVGGSVRDFLLNRKKIITDWDIATNAKPEEIQAIFPRSIYDNDFFTVFIFPKDPVIKNVHITTFRKDKEYLDKRHPTSLAFGKTIKEDLERRDFTINALALKLLKNSATANNLIEIDNLRLELLDVFQGIKDLENKTIRCVGNPNERFNEDALRLMRAIRFATELNFQIEKDTFNSIKKNSQLINSISKERIRDEFIKIVQSENPDRGIDLLKTSELLKFIIPELLEGDKCLQNKHHIYDVYTHNVYSLKYAALYKYSLEVRLAALFHDIAKPYVKKGEYPAATFYHHEIVGANLTKEILERLKFPAATIKKVVHLVRHHLFYYDIGKVTESGVRRFIKRVGKENIQDLLNLRIAERKGSGVPKAKPYRLRHFEYMIEKVQKDPITTSMLKIDGNDVMKTLDIQPGPKIGLILNALLEKVLNNPKKNTIKYLKNQIKKINLLSDDELKLKSQGIDKFKESQDKNLRGKYFV